VYRQTRLKGAARFPVDKMVDKFGDSPDTADSMRESKFCDSQKTSCQNINQAYSWSHGSKSGSRKLARRQKKKTPFNRWGQHSLILTNTSEGEAKAIPSTWVRRTQLVESRPHGETGAAFVCLRGNELAVRHPLHCLSKAWRDV
jgi:hypothetical protein